MRRYQILNATMKVVAVLFAVLAVALAAPANPDAEAQVLRSELDNIGVDGFKWGYETSNGISADETGELINAGSENEAVAVRGSFQYVGPDGVTYKVTYIADENGFQPQGAHLPVAPQ
ncbi:flexible cuticle protein 12-like [Aethina tumida]|uniref:flexible cuticle protein 12-like n=1 Tax=Aethina tumida TaxID=116153 RepID=UPI00096B0C2B|nr:flexible cuticle protein 12-like [Aethina tumida]